VAYYNLCADCGCRLDPGEKCDCREKSEQLRKKYEKLTAAGNGGQIEFGGLYEYNKNQDQELVRA
jgi:hypothetical protein